MLEFKPINSRTVWERFLLQSEQVNFLHSWAWGETQRQLGQSIERWGIYDHGDLQGLIFFIVVKAKRATYLECPGGPVITWKMATVRAVTAWLKEQARIRRASFVRVRPNILATTVNFTLLQQADWRRAPMHLHAETTWVLPLIDSEASLMQNMRKTTRYLVNKAVKAQVKIIQSTSLTDIDQLFNLQQATVDRKHFVPFTKKYFTAEMRSFLPNNIGLFKAEYQGQLLAMAMIIFYGQEAVYHYSGSSNEHREVPASYLLQWAVINEAKRRGYKYYNFWGYTAQAKHRFFGPSLFKKGFGGHEVNYLPAHDLVVSLSYWTNFIIETIRRKWRRL